MSLYLSGRPLLEREGARATDGGMLEGIQLGSEGGQLLPLLSPSEGSLLCSQPDRCIIQLSLCPDEERADQQANTKAPAPCCPASQHQQTDANTITQQQLGFSRQIATWAERGVFTHADGAAKGGNSHLICQVLYSLRQAPIFFIVLALLLPLTIASDTSAFRACSGAAASGAGAIAAIALSVLFSPLTLAAFNRLRATPPLPMCVDKTWHQRRSAALDNVVPKTRPQVLEKALQQRPGKLWAVQLPRQLL
ncbi:MAG: hypothetical protein FRX49_09666 [Trebouxia sp. A1-2]|nr:MAG: hypothetical protein FRX49_09666 [Trebouxia sp. A1-2]